jgi:hypothetical protein
MFSWSLRDVGFAQELYLLEVMPGYSARFLLLFITATKYLAIFSFGNCLAILRIRRWLFRQNRRRIYCGVPRLSIRDPLPKKLSEIST